MMSGRVLGSANTLGGSGDGRADMLSSSPPLSSSSNGVSPLQRFVRAKAKINAVYDEIHRYAPLLWRNAVNLDYLTGCLLFDSVAILKYVIVTVMSPKSTDSSTPCRATVLPRRAQASELRGNLRRRQRLLSSTTPSSKKPLLMLAKLTGSDVF